VVDKQAHARGALAAWRQRSRPSRAGRSAAHGAAGGGGHLEKRVDLLCGGGPLHLKHAVGEGAVEQRHPHRQPVQLALQLCTPTGGMEGGGGEAGGSGGRVMG
jgi:hypothetical protein